MSATRLSYENFEVFIACIVVIDNESKIRNEIRQFTKELGVDDVREFSSSIEFEREFFSSLIKKPEAPKVQKISLAHLPSEILTYLNTVEFSKNKPFDRDSIEIEIDSTSLQITKVSVAKAFDSIVTELIARNTKFDSLCVPEFSSHLLLQIEKLKKLDNSPVEIYAFKTKSKAVWIIEVRGKYLDSKLHLTLTDKTHEYGKLLGKITEDAKADAAKDEPEKQKHVDVIVFRYTCINTKDIKKWVTKTSALLNKANLWPLENRPRFIVVRYEDDPKEKDEFNHPFIDDLICLPFDRLIFLQKLEIVLNLPKKIAPSYLFVQASSDDIEISKKVSLERFNDLGVAVVNPIPLAPGTPGHFYFRFPGQKPLLDVYGKASSSVRHPEKENAHHVYFNFFGLNKVANREIRAYLARDTAYKNLKESDPNNFKFSPENIFISDQQKKRKTIAILDIDENSLKNLSDYFKKEIDNLDVAFDDTYYGFFKKYLGVKQDLVHAIPARPEDFFSEMISILIDLASLNIQMPLTPANEADLFLGIDAKKMFDDPQGWLRVFDGDARNLLTECLHLVTSTRRISKNFEVKNAAGELRTINVEFLLEENNRHVRINFKPPDLKLLNKSGHISRIESLDCIVIDYALLPEDIDAFIASLTNAATAANISTPPGGPRIIVLVSESQNPKFNKIFASKVFAMLYKPIEIRRILYLASIAIDTPFTVYSFDNIGWKSDAISAKIARPAQLVELSEFGATIRTEQPLKPGTMIYLFKSIFTHAPDQNLCVRVYASEEDTESEGADNFYLNHVVYFGITDAFLKYTRSYIRETYATSKAKANG